MAPRRRRKILIWLGSILLGLTILIAALPLWLPLVLRPVAGKFGARYDSYERVGYGRFALHHVTYASGAAKFTADRVEVFMPSTWLWRRYLGRHDDGRDYLLVDRWRLEILPAKAKSTNATAATPWQWMEKIEAKLPLADHWLPRAKLNNGVAVISTNQFIVPSLVWGGRVLEGKINSPGLGQTVSLKLDLATKHNVRIAADISPLALGAQIKIVRDGQELKVDGTADFQTNRINLVARFGPEEIWPATASISSDAFRFSAKLLKLEGYDDLSGAMSIDWATNRFRVDVAAKAEPASEQGKNLPPVRAVFQANGDAGRIQINTLDVSAPWFSANLSKPLELDRNGNVVGREAKLDLVANLSNQKFFAATGALSGEVTILSSDRRFPGIDFVLATRNLGSKSFQTETVEVQGNLDWPWLQINRGHVRLAEKSGLEARARINVVAQYVESGSLQFDGFIAEELLPEDYDYDRLQLALDFSGPWQRLTHSGKLQLTGFESPNFKNLDLAASWRGKMLDLDHFEAKISTTNADLSFAGLASVQSNKMGLQLEACTLSGSNQVLLTLSQPARIIFQSARRPVSARVATVSPDNQKQNVQDPKKEATKVEIPQQPLVESLPKPSSQSQFLVDIEPIHLQGPQSALGIEAHVDWPQRGRIAVTASNLTARLADLFRTNSAPDLRLNDMNLAGAWTNGPATFSVSADATYVATNGEQFSARVTAASTNSGVTIKNLWVADRHDEIIDGQGFVPVIIEPARSGEVLQVQTNRPVEFQAVTKPNPRFWDDLAGLVGLRLVNPIMNVSVAGSMLAPEGKVSFLADEISFVKAGTNRFPRVQKLKADMDLTRSLAKLNSFTFLIEDQPVTATGDFPLPQNFRGGLKNAFDWRKADARLTVKDFKVAAVEPFFQTLISPQGTFDLDVAVRRGKMDGHLFLTNAATRPLGTLGVAQDVQAQVFFADEQIRVEKISALVGGESLVLNGLVELGKINPANHLPQFALKVKGDNVPLTRQPDVIVRSDLDVSISNSNAPQPLISGTVNLRESFYLGDLDQLMPGRVAAPSKRPPYFSIEMPALADWQVRLRVRGEKFLRVKTPFFTGTVSTTMRVENNLREPLALGEVKIDQGTIVFPFGNLYVQQGIVSLTSSDPYHPQVFITANSRSYGYDVKMLASGGADKPVIQFSSTPELTSEQIILMMTAGEMPRDEIHYSSQQRASRFAMFLGKNILSKFGTDAGSERLTIRSGEEVSESGRETYSLEYRLTPKWSLYGEYDKYAAINAGVKWKAYSK